MPKPSTMRALRRLAVVCVLVAAAGVYAFSARPWEAKPVPVTVQTLSAGVLRDVLAVNGQIVPSRQVDIAAPVAGQIVDVLVAEGDSVKKGQVLAKIDDSIAAAAVDQASASLQSVQISMNEAEAAWKRAKALGTAISSQTRDGARFAYETAKANVAQLLAAETQARQQLARYRIVAPMDGVLLSVSADPGQVVSTSATLFSIGDLTKPLIEASVDETYGSRMKLGLSARVAPIGVSRPVAAHVTFVAPTVDPDTGSRIVKLAFDQQPAEQLPSGLTVSVNIVVGSHDNAISVPRFAILDLGSAPYVFVLADDKAVKRKISVADWPSDSLRVTAGLKAGDRLILDPGPLADGTLVTAQPAS